MRSYGFHPDALLSMRMALVTAVFDDRLAPAHNLVLM